MNLLEPLRFEQPAEAEGFARRHRCALCLAPLNATWTGVFCPHCGPMYQHTVTSIHTAEQTISDRLIGEREMRPDRKPRPADEILKELGFD